MWKNSLAIIVIGSLVTGSSFATPLHVKKMFMKNQLMKSSLIANNHTQNSQFRFSGVWTGTCNYNGENQETKIRINENDFALSIIDLMNEGMAETVLFDVVKSESNTDKNWYTSFTSRLTRINENTLRFEGTQMFANQLPSANQEKGLTSGVLTSIFTVNNNQLNIDTSMKMFHENKNENIEGKCILKRTG